MEGDHGDRGALGLGVDQHVSSLSDVSESAASTRAGIGDEEDALMADVRDLVAVRRCGERSAREGRPRREREASVDEPAPEVAGRVSGHHRHAVVQVDEHDRSVSLERQGATGEAKVGDAQRAVGRVERAIVAAPELPPRVRQRRAREFAEVGSVAVLDRVHAVEGAMLLAAAPPGATLDALPGRLLRAPITTRDRGVRGHGRGSRPRPRVARPSPLVAARAWGRRFRGGTARTDRERAADPQQRSERMLHTAPVAPTPSGGKARQGGVRCSP